jgi:hypothetical protein
MKRVFATVGTLAVVWVAPLGGASVDCVPQQKCEEGQRPPSCCQPPPCEIFEHLKQMRAIRRMMTDARAKKALRLSKGDHGKAIASLRHATFRERGRLGSLIKCTMGQRPYVEPEFRLTDKCELEVQTESGWSPVAGRPPGDTAPGSANEVYTMSLPERFDLCNESVEAAFVEWSHRREFCTAEVSEGDVEWWAFRERAGAQQNIDTTMLHLENYFRACSRTLDGERLDDATRSQLEEAGIDTSDLDNIYERAVKALMRGTRR